MAEARHAVSACSTGDWGVYAVGGWANGNVCTGAVDFLDLREETKTTTEAAAAQEDANGGRGGANEPVVGLCKLDPVTP